VKQRSLQPARAEILVQRLHGFVDTRRDVPVVEAYLHESPIDIIKK
jgi:hypothetical protein